MPQSMLVVWMRRWQKHSSGSCSCKLDPWVSCYPTCRTHYCSLTEKHPSLTFGTKFTQTPSRLPCSVLWRLVALSCIGVCQIIHSVNSSRVTDSRSSLAGWQIQGPWVVVNIWHGCSFIVNPTNAWKIACLPLWQSCKVLCRWALFCKTAACSRKGQQITK